VLLHNIMFVLECQLAFIGKNKMGRRLKMAIFEMLVQGASSMYKTLSGPRLSFTVPLFYFLPPMSVTYERLVQFTILS
jgi:hypothetical protein